MTRRRRRTRRNSRAHFGQRYRNRRRGRRAGKGRVWQRCSSAMPRSAQACRHSGPCGAMRRRPARAWATRCASSWRRVRSTSAAPCSCSCGFNETSARRKSARPAAVRRRGFHSTCTRGINVVAPTSINSARASLSSCGSRPPPGRARVSGAGVAGALEKKSSSCLKNSISFGPGLPAGGAQPLDDVDDYLSCGGHFVAGGLFA